MSLVSFYLEDRILANGQIDEFSVDVKQQCTEDNPTDFELFSDRMSKKYPSYTYDCKLVRVLPGKDSPKINFNDLREILLSKDLSRYSELPETSGKNFLFLDGEADTRGFRSTLISYPRSGNSFMRNYVMRVSGTYTGSDIPAIQLQNAGFLGDHTTNDMNTVWCTKTHFPIVQRVFHPVFHTEKVFLIVRNPLDFIFSQITYITAMGHSLQIENEIHQEFPE